MCHKSIWGWDNPFSYNKKMKEQELLTKQLKPGINQINDYSQMIFPYASAVLILESVFQRENEAFGVVKKRNVKNLIIRINNEDVSREWGIWRQK